MLSGGAALALALPVDSRLYYLKLVLGRALIRSGSLAATATGAFGVPLGAVDSRRRRDGFSLVARCPFVRARLRRAPRSLQGEAVHSPKGRSPRLARAVMEGR